MIAAAALAIAGAAPVKAQSILHVLNNSDNDSPGSLRFEIEQANMLAGPVRIDFASPFTINLTADLPPLTNPAGVTINGSNSTIDGSSVSNTTGFRGFFVGVSADAAGPNLAATNAATYDISSLTIRNTNARGGNGGRGYLSGGGGGGLGGAIFVNAGTLNLSQVTLQNNRAVGGNGGTFLYAAGGGGGGMGGNGANGAGTATGILRGGGGGGFGTGANGGTNGSAGAPGMFFLGTAGGAGGGSGGAGGTQGGGGGGGGTAGAQYGSGGGGGGVGGTNGSIDFPGSNYSPGGAGGFGGGGGGAGRNFNVSLWNNAPAGAGGYGAGGGGDGNGGFGGGAGGFTGYSPLAQPGFGGGLGALGADGGGIGNGGGGGGAGLGGAVFVRQGATLNLVDGAFSGNSVVAGLGGVGGLPNQPSPNGINGQAIGQAMFLAGNARYSVSGGNTVTVSDTLGGGADALISGGLTKADPGILVLSGDNTYVGPTTIEGGTLRVGHNHALGVSGAIQFKGGSLQYTAANQVDYSARIANSTSPISIDTNGISTTYSSALAASNTGGLTKLGTGTLALAAANNYSGPTSVISGTLRLDVANALPNTAVTLFGGDALLQVRASQTISSLANSPAFQPQTDISGALTVLTTNQGSSTDYSGTIGGTGTLRKVGSTTLTLSGGTSNALNLQVAGGVVELNKLGPGANAVQTISELGTGATVRLLAHQLLGQTIFGDQIADSGGVTMTGGMLDMNGCVESFDALNGTGVVTNSQGLPALLRIGSGVYDGLINNGGSGLQLVKQGSGALTLTGPLTNQSTEITGGSLTISGSAANTTPLKVSGGVVELAKTGAYGASAVSGITALATGAVVRLNGSQYGDQIADTGGVNLTGGVLDMNGRSDRFNTLNGTGLIFSTQGPLASLLVGSGTYSGTIDDGPTGLSLFKTGSGSLVLTGTLTHRSTEIYGGTVELTNQVVKDMTVHDGGTLRVQPAGGKAVHLSTVTSIDPGGMIDVTNNGLVFSAGNEANVRTWLARGYNGGAWNGSGINSSTAASRAIADAVGYGLASQVLGIADGQTATFLDKTVTPTATLVRYTYYGDTDLNGRVNFDDYVRTDNGFNNHLSGWFNGDFDYNGQVNFDDYVLIDLAFNTQSGTLGRALSFLDGSDRSARDMNNTSLRRVEQHFAQFGSDYASHFLAAVPEPTSLAFASVAMALLSRRRRRPLPLTSEV
jgi:autotransporter-associated beta strand protein